MNTLKLFTLVKLEDGTEARVPFPNDIEQAEISTYEYSASRMGGAPSITAKISHRFCLDKFWNEKQFVEFNGEKFFVRDTPSSSKNNDDSRYEHDVTFLHERYVLENVYMIDAVQKDDIDTMPATDKYVSNSTKFVFWGDINELVGRFNACLLYAGLGGKNDGKGYYVVVDKDVSSEELLVSFEDKLFSEALQEIFNTFKLPYYWEGKVCHVGVSPEPVKHLFEYGANNALLSIEKQNTNQGYCNRATGVGSADNIPYYYPNEASSDTTKPHAVSSEDGTTGNKGITDDTKIAVINENDFSKLAKCLPSEAPWDNYGIIYSGNENSCEFYVSSNSIKILDLIGQSKYGDWFIKLLHDEYRHLDNLSSYMEYGYVSFDKHHVTATCNKYDTQVNEYWEYKLYMYESFSNAYYNHMIDFMTYYLMGTPKKLDLLYHCIVTKRGNYARICFPIGYWIGGVAQKVLNFKIEISDIKGNHVADLKIQDVVGVNPEIDPSTGINLITIDVEGLDKFSDNFILHVTCDIHKYKAYIEDRDSFPPEFIDHNASYFYDRYNTGDIRFNVVDGKVCSDDEEAFMLRVGKLKEQACEIQISPIIVSHIPSRWHEINKLSIGEQRGLDHYGLSSTQTPQDGDRIVRLYNPEFSRMVVQQRLMPTIYRETDGELSFYNANNNPDIQALCRVLQRRRRKVSAF